MGGDTFSAKTVPYSPYEDSANLQGCCEADMALFYRKKYENMTKLELLIVLYSLDSHLDKDDIATARSVVKRIIAEAEKHP
ncbi:MAG: hypothetical protein FWC89_04635 [Defluviitaleaceae bacterium]|nr:hypothetical protein [Defluviitaleaceae bacterium]